LYNGRNVGIVAVRIVTVSSVEDQRIRPTVSSVGCQFEFDIWRAGTAHE
jgi:hypothetical protein